MALMPGHTKRKMFALSSRNWRKYHELPLQYCDSVV
jgi:hypothetical protein